MTAISMPQPRFYLLHCLALSLIQGLLACAVLGLSGCAVGHASPHDADRWLPLAPQIWWLPGEVASSNAANLGNISNHLFVLDTTDGHSRGWLIGSGASPVWGHRLRTSLRVQLGAEVTDIIAPRAHPETVLGASAFPHARHWALPEVTKAMTGRCPICLENLKHQTGDASLLPATVRLPDHEIAALGISATDTQGQAAASMLLPRRAQMGPLDVWAVQRSVSDWTTLIHHRDSGYWFSPGLVWGAGGVPELREANTLYLIATLDWLQGQVDARSRIVPEQGAPGTAELLAIHQSYWKALQAECELAQERGDGELDFIGIKTHPVALKDAFDGTALNAARQSLNRQRIWREVEDR